MAGSDLNRIAASPMVAVAAVSGNAGWNLGIKLAVGASKC